MEVAHDRGPMCGEKAFLDACPVRRNLSAVIQGTFFIPKAAPSGYYKIVFEGIMENKVRLFCIATKFHMSGRETEKRTLGSS